MYIRRWSIQPLPTNPNNTLVHPGARHAGRERRRRVSTSAFTRTRMAGDALLVTVKTRKAS